MYSSGRYSLTTDALDSKQHQYCLLPRRSFLIEMDDPALVLDVVSFVWDEMA